MKPEDQKNIPKDFISKYFSETSYTDIPHIQAIPEVLEQFWSRIVSVFDDQRLLRGQDLKERVNKILPENKEILQQLKEIQRKHKDDPNETYRIFVSMVVIPLCKEGNELKKRLNTNHESMLIEVIAKHAGWIGRYRRWVDVYQRQEQFDLSKELLNHVVTESIASIEKDMEVVAEYAQQQINKTNMILSKKEKLKKEIYEKLTPICHRFKALKLRRPEKGLTEIQKWQRDITKERQKNFDEALSIIDKSVEEVVPQHSSAEEHGQLVDVLERISDLEKAIPNVLGPGALIDKNLLQNEITALEEEARSLSLDLRIPQDLFERIQTIIAILKEASKKISEE